ncbi:MAG: hypothetical protein WHX52_17940 [Anaerolineae bacterium]
MTVKTAISLENSLFQKVNDLAQELKISRSHLFTLAVQQFIESYENQRLLEKINAVYADGPDPEEVALLQRMRAHHRQLVEGQW